MAAGWQDYQEEAAEFFRSLGMDAETNVSVFGVRTHHDLDVAVRSSHAGFDIFWVIECKQWQSRVSKLHVLGLRSIVADLGADRGILLSEVGFQSGAAEAAMLTNIRLTSLADLELSTRMEVAKIRLANLSDRVVACKERYWNIPKEIRIEHGLRPGGSPSMYSGRLVIEYVEEVLLKALGGRFPFDIESVATITQRLPDSIGTPIDAVEVAGSLLSDLEARLRACENQVLPR